MKDIWIAGITRGHNGGVCLLKNGKVIFNIEEERLSRQKYDGGPLATMLKIKEYTDKLDFIAIAHTQSLQETAGKIDFTYEDIYTGLARKLGLIARRQPEPGPHPQVIDLSNIHHKLHAACAFYRSGFDSAAALVVDGAGTFVQLNTASGAPTTAFETESIFDCSYPFNFKTIYKHLAVSGPSPVTVLDKFPSERYNEPESDSHYLVVSETAGIVKVYEAVTQYCGWPSIEAGKTMGLFPYGKETDKFPELFNKNGAFPVANRNIVIPTYPNGALINSTLFPYLDEHDATDITLLDNRRDLAYAVQTQTQDQVLALIRKAVEMTGHNKVVISGGYGLNCVANYYYLEHLRDEGIEIYVEPISNDAGTAMGAAMLIYMDVSKEQKIDYSKDGLYLGFEYNYSTDDINDIASEYNLAVSNVEYEDIVSLLLDKNIVTMFQGRSENGPRALGNRSILFNPMYEDGKDFVNSVKHREYFRPFAGTIMQEYVHEWFDLRGMKDSPYMMYAVNCQPGVAEKIPSIIHVDGTCRIQTVTNEQNKHFYSLINAFYEKTGVPVLFNTSFNLGGDPLVETLEDAADTIAKSEMNYLYLPEYGKLLSKINNDIKQIEN
jgi:carbamoyltransferase